MTNLVVPLLVALGAVIALTVILVVTIRFVRRNRRAQAAAIAAREKAGSTLVDVSDGIFATDTLLALTATGNAHPSASLTRARGGAVRVRDEMLTEYRSLVDDPPATPRLKQRALALERVGQQALAGLQREMDARKTWLSSHLDVSAQVQALRTRLDEVRVDFGDPAARSAEIAHFAASEVTAVQLPIARTQERMQTATKLLDRVQGKSSDAALDELISAEVAVRSAEENAVLTDDAHTQLLRADEVVDDQIESVQDLIRSAKLLHGHVSADQLEAITTTLRETGEDVDALGSIAHTRPLETIAHLTHIRERVGTTIGASMSARAQLDGAKSSLPGTLATARALIARATFNLDAATNHEAQLHLAIARAEVANARSATDVFSALESAWRAIRSAEHADEVIALARGEAHEAIPRPTLRRDARKA